MLSNEQRNDCKDVSSINVFKSIFARTRLIDRYMEIEIWVYNFCRIKSRVQSLKPFPLFPEGRQPKNNTTAMCFAEVVSLLLATRGSSLCLSNTSDLLDSALDFLSLLSALLSSHKVAVLFNNSFNIYKSSKIQRGFQKLLWE